MRFDSGEKTLFKNQTGGFIGVTIYTPAGDEKGVSVAPGETIRMSEAEREITAQAPRLAKDNPFAEQDIEFYDPESGEKTVKRMAPLIPWSEERVTGVADSREENATTKRRSRAAKKPAAKPRTRSSTSKPAA